jgi:ribonuclease BN (tRNA processing enzyme)
MDMIKVTILGSGTGYPTLRRSACSVLVKIGTEQLLFDMGVGTIRRLLEAGSSISLITHIFFSHLHPDHTGEFASMLFAMKYPEVYKRRNPFMVIGKGIDAFYSGLKGIYGKWVELDPDILHLIDLDREDKDRLVFPEFEVIIRPMPHIESSIGYRITFNNGKSIVYTGDTDFSEDVIILAK